MTEINVTPQEAIDIFKNIRSPEFNVFQKRQAVKMIARMKDPIPAKITKADLMEVIRWQQGVIKA